MDIDLNITIEFVISEEIQLEMLQTGTEKF